MSRVPATPTVRRRRLAVDLLLFLVLLALLAFLFLSSQTPYLTEKQALAAHRPSISMVPAMFWPEQKRKIPFSTCFRTGTAMPSAASPAVTARSGLPAV